MHCVLFCALSVHTIELFVLNLIVAEKVYATVLKGQGGDVQAAVTAAAKAFVSWGRLSDHGRAKHLYR